MKIASFRIIANNVSIIILIIAHVYEQIKWKK